MDIELFRSTLFHMETRVVSNILLMIAGKYTQGLCHYQFMIILDKCNGNCNTLMIYLTKNVFKTKGNM